MTMSYVVDRKREHMSEQSIEMIGHEFLMSDMRAKCRHPIQNVF